MCEPISIGLWNVQWASRGRRGAFFTRRLRELSCHILCVTEGYADILPDGGHAIASDADYGYPIARGRRKVLLWSRNPWRDIDALGSALLPPGRFVAGRTNTPCGSVRIVGVCIPWKDAHVRTGRRDRKPWEDHLTYLQNLPPLIRSDNTTPTVVLGDFNQRVPRRHQPEHVFTALTAVFDPDFRFATAGSIPGTPDPAIDHAAVRGGLVPSRIEFLSNYDDGNERMSDHFGLRILLERSR